MPPTNSSISLFAEMRFSKRVGLRLNLPRPRFEPLQKDSLLDGDNSVDHLQSHLLNQWSVAPLAILTAGPAKVVEGLT